MTRLEIERRIVWAVLVLGALAFWVWFFPLFVRFVVWAMLRIWTVA